MTDPVLCFIRDNNFAYFTTALPDQMWGEGWHKIPYQHNASAPHPYEDRMMCDPYELTCVYFHVAAQTPDRYSGDSYSVKQINQKRIPWLLADQYTDNIIPPIMAGTTLSDFKRIIKEAGGEIYSKEG
jgi:hypothetical protein